MHVFRKKRLGYNVCWISLLLFTVWSHFQLFLLSIFYLKFYLAYWGWLSWPGRGHILWSSCYIGTFWENLPITENEHWMKKKGGSCQQLLESLNIYSYLSTSANISYFLTILSETKETNKNYLNFGL